MKHIYSLLASIFIFNLTYAQTTWVQVWADEFNYEGQPDPTKWGYDIGGNGWGNNELQYYTDRIENAYVSDGVLTIATIKENYEGSDYTSARLTSKNKADWKYGKFEVMAKIPTGRGAWSAIWMLPTENLYGGWPSSGEIDIMENVGYAPDEIHGTIHTESYNHQAETQIGESITTEDPFDSFHKYTVEWYEDKLIFLFDDVAYLTIEKQPGDTYAEWPFDQYFHLLLNTAIGGDWGGSQGIDNALFPKYYEIDYVRVYTLSEDQSQYNLTINENTGGSSSSNASTGPVNKNTQVTITATPAPEYEFVRWKGTYASFNSTLSFEMLSNVEVTPVFKKIGEMIDNGSFEEGTNNWYINTGGSASTSTAGEGLQITNNTSQANAWDIQLQQSPINLQAGHTYKFQYTISTENSLTLTAGVGLNEAPWSTYQIATESVNNATVTFEYTFTMNVDNPDARVIFDLGKTVGTYTINNISLVDLTVVTNSSKNETVPINIFPNPSSDYVHINGDITITNINIYNISGQLVSSGTATPLNISTLAPGIYVLQIKTADTHYTQKIVIE